MAGSQKQNDIKKTSERVTTELNLHLQNLVSTYSVGSKLHKQNIHGRVTFVKLLVAPVNKNWEAQQCQKRTTWIADQYNHVM